MKGAHKMDIMDYFEEQLKQNFPQQRIHAIRALLDESYEIVDEMYRRNSDQLLTSTHLGKDIRADILRACIAHVAQKYCYDGILPYKFATPTNHAKNSHHVRLSNANISIYFARVETSQEVPRYALYRPTYNNIQGTLFGENNWDLSPVNVFCVTYGDSGESQFKYGNIGVLGKSSWLSKLPLTQGAYVCSKPHEKEELLVELADALKDDLKKDDKDARGSKN